LGLSNRGVTEPTGSRASGTDGPWARSDREKAGSRGDQRDFRGGWKIEVERRMGRSNVASGALAEESSGSAGKGSTPSPQSSALGGGCGLEVEGGADLFEHEGPLQGLGRGNGSAHLVAARWQNP
jgi:hypothetical protein